MPSWRTMISLLFGISAATTAQRESAGGISGWDEFLIVVVGSIAAAAILAAAQWVRKRYNRPVLVVEVGDGYDFDKKIGSTDQWASSSVENHDFHCAFGKFVRVREVNGRGGASNVVVRLRDVVPPVPHTESTVELQWADHSEANDIRPDGHKSLALLRVLFYSGRHVPGGGWRCSPTFFDHAPQCDFTLELFVDGEPHKKVRLSMKSNPWSNEPLEAALMEAHLGNSKWPPEELDFPSVEALE